MQVQHVHGSRKKHMLCSPQHTQTQLIPLLVVLVLLVDLVVVLVQIVVLVLLDYECIVLGVAPSQ